MVDRDKPSGGVDAKLTEDAFLERLSSADAFAELSASELKAAAARFEQRIVEPDDIVIEQGKAPASVFVLLAGRLDVVVDHGGRQEHHLADLGPGAIVGEIALLAGGRHSATVRATERSHLATLDASGFNALLDAHPPLAARLADLSSQRLRGGQLVSQVASLFSTLDHVELRELERAVEWVSLPAGKTLFEEGEPGDYAYVLVSGRLHAAIRDGDGSNRIVGEIGPGEMVGEYALMLNEPRRATVTACRDSDLAGVPRSVFEKLLERFPRIMLELSRTIIRRSDSRHGQARSPRSERRTTAVVPLGNPLDAEAVTEALVRELDQYGGAIHLSAERVDSMLEKPGMAVSAPPDPGHIRLLQWLSQLESTHRHVVYETHPTFDRWTERAIRHADQTILVADARSDPTMLDVEVALAALRKHSHQRTVLVLLHAHDETRPRGTAAWLAARDVDAVYHVRRRDPADMARLGRIFGGRALGLVLGGGGARGFAHLGILRALEELRVPVDMVGSTSIGAPIGHLPAKGLGAAEAEDVISSGFRSLIDYTLPISSLVNGKRISDMISHHADDRDIEDLWLPFYCISSDITAAREVAHIRGNLARAMRASVSLPGILPPVPEAGHLLVDGGVLNNLPIDVMRDLNPTGPVIAVDVVPRRGPTAESDYGLSVSGWRVATSWMNPFVPSIRVPRVGATIVSSMLVGAEQGRARQLDAELADLYLNLDVGEVGLLDFGRVREIAQIGYEQSLPVLQQWIERGGLESGDASS